MRSLRLVFSAVLLSISVLPAFSQSPTGVLPFESFSGDQFESVNVSNLNLHVTIPLVKRAGRGIPFYYGLVYDSQIWVPSNGVWATAPNTGSFGWQGATNSGFVTYAVTIRPVNCGTDGGSKFTFTSVTDGFGVTHSITPNLVLYDNLCGAHPQGGVALTDGSGYSFWAQVVMYGETIQQTLLYTSSGTALSKGGGAADANGNQITVAKNGSTTTYTDTLGSTALTISGTVPTITYTYPGPSGSLAYTVQYTTKTVQTNFGCTGVSEYPATSQQLPTQINLPDGTGYTIAY